MDAAYDAELWHEFFVMLGGVAAVLAGLLFVALSLQMATDEKALQRGARNYFVNITAVLLVCCAGLVPAQSADVVGAEVGLLGAGLVVSFVMDVLHIWRESGALSARLLRWGPPRVLAQLTLIWGGVSVTAEAGGGWYVVAAGCVAITVFFLQSSWWTMQGGGVPALRTAVRRSEAGP